MINNFMSGFRVKISFVILLLSITLHAQNQYTFKQFGKETSDFVKQPSKWNSNDWTKLGIIAASTFVVSQVDEQIRNYLLTDRSYYNSIPIEAGRIWGEPYATVTFGGGFGLYGIIQKDNASKRIGYEIFQSALYAGVITTFLKAVVGRARPYTNQGYSSFNPFSLFNDDYHSIPSGHTTLAFSLSTILSQNSKSDLIKAIAYLPAIITAFSRVYQDKHWTSDVFLSAVIGYFVGIWVHIQHNMIISNPAENVQLASLLIRF